MSIIKKFTKGLAIAGASLLLTIGPAFGASYQDTTDVVTKTCAASFSELEMGTLAAIAAGTAIGADGAGGGSTLRGPHNQGRSCVGRCQG